jgi:hypothetical protein
MFRARVSLVDAWRLCLDGKAPVRSSVEQWVCGMLMSPAWYRQPYLQVIFTSRRVGWESH